MLADGLDYVIGVDTHRDQHAVAVVDAGSGAVIAQTAAAASAEGYAQVLRFVANHAPGARVWAIEGAGHYGAGLVRHLQRQGEQVQAVERTSRAERRLRGKDDRLDAVRAARSSLAHTQRARPRGGEHQEALRLLLLARRTAVDTRRVALVQLRSVIVTAPDELRSELRRLRLGELLNRCSRFRPHPRPCARARTPRRAWGRADRRRPADRHLVPPRPHRLRDSPTIYLLMAAAVGVVIVGARLLRGRRAVLTGEPIGWTTTRPTRSHVLGSVLFGIGWAFSRLSDSPLIAADCVRSAP